VKLFIYI